MSEDEPIALKLHDDGCSQPAEEVGFGLAGGGYGAYGYCPECYFIQWKSQEYDDGGEA